MTARALLDWGTYEQWLPETDPRHRSTPLDGIGITLGHGSWPPYDASEATTELRVWPNPALFDEPGRYGTVDAWCTEAGKAIPGGRLTADLTRRRRPAVIPWARAWTGAGGTQWERSDNGVIVENPDGTAWVIQGLRRATVFDRLQLNLRLWANVARDGDMVADAIRFDAPDRVQRGSQGPWSKRRGLLRPEHFTGEVPPPATISFVGFNVAHGPGAIAATGAWVEHPGKGQRARSGGLPVRLPEGHHPDLMILPGERFPWFITNAAISDWLDSENVPPTDPLRQTKRKFAVMVRSGEHPSDAPDAEGVLACEESGTAQPIIQCTGAVGAYEAAKWAALGITDPTIARNLGRGMFPFGTFGEAA